MTFEYNFLFGFELVVTPVPLIIYGDAGPDVPSATYNPP
jgi:hypothetical protein